MENGYLESFHSRFREECLNEHWFIRVLSKARNAASALIFSLILTGS
jgi:hypothetical protein